MQADDDGNAGRSGLHSHAGVEESIRAALKWDCTLYRMNSHVVSTYVMLYAHATPLDEPWGRLASNASRCVRHRQACATMLTALPSRFRERTRPDLRMAAAC